MTMNPEAQTVFDTILGKLSRKETLLQHEASFLRARRSYLTRWQRIKYGDILYLNKQFLFQKMRDGIVLLVRFAKEIVIALVVGLIILLVSKFLRL